MNTSPPSVLTHWWVDLELTGLETPGDEIVEFGVIGTDSDFNPIFRQKIVVLPTAAGLARIHAQDIVLNMHQSNGLLDELTLGYLDGSLPDIHQAEQLLIEAIDAHAPADKLILSGSGVWHCDIRFLKLFTPELFDRFDRREILDVGTERRSYLRATGSNLTEANAGKNHRADVDIQCSLDEGLAFLEMKREHAARIALVSA
jgi:oligoribonuclease (3'-5' exoribonuclease)